MGLTTCFHLVVWVLPERTLWRGQGRITDEASS